MLAEGHITGLAWSSYEEGRYSEAVLYMERGIEMGEMTLLLPCADIYRRSLDGKVRAPEEAASLYLRASDCGDGDAMSYLRSVSPFLINVERPFPERIRLLVIIWRKHSHNCVHSIEKH